MSNLISIIGAGPAGIATAMQLKRLGYDPLLLEMDRIGGLLWNANLIENYPGFPNGISGPKLIKLMENQMVNLAIKVTDLCVKELKGEKKKYVISTETKSFRSDYIVIASGTKPKSIPMEISDNIKTKIHQNIINLLKIKDKHIVIIGSGDAAFDQALNLSRRNNITILNRNSRTDCLPLLVNRALSEKKITYLTDMNVDNITLQSSAKKDSEKTLLIQCKLNNNKCVSLECDEVVFAIGRVPSLDFCPNIGFNDHCSMVGDVKNGVFRQASIAIGDGIMAAMKIHNIILRGNR